MNSQDKINAPATPGFNNKIPEQIMTPDTVETRIGTLKFFDGFPTKETTQKVYDNLDFLRGVEVFLNTARAASALANFNGLKSVGCNNQTVVLHEDRVDAKTLLLTPNTQTATLWAYMNLKDGPLVVEVPPVCLGWWTMRGCNTSRTSASLARTRAKAVNSFSCRPATPVPFQKATLSSHRAPITCSIAMARQ